VDPGHDFVGRGGEKLRLLIEEWELGERIRGAVCADVGANVGGFTECLLRYGAGKVFSIEKGRRKLAYSLKQDERVENVEGTNALQYSPREKVDIIVSDTGWTRQSTIVPKLMRWLAPGGAIYSLVKTQYEAGDDWAIRKGRGTITEEVEAAWFELARKELEDAGILISRQWISPLRGKKGGSGEYWIEVLC